MGSGATAGFNAGNATSGAPAGTAANGATAGMNGAAVGGGNVPIYGGSSGITGVGIAGIGAATTLGGRSSSGGGNLGIAGVTTTAAGAGNAGAQACPGTGGPTMVMLPQGYCIDSTEVTRAQYGAWLSSTTAATINAQDIATCSWNTSFVPHEGCMAGSYVCQGSGCGNHPQVCVDWCDAVAFCKGVGKRLCGKIGGGPNAYDASQWATASQLYQACSSGGKYKYPYGDNDAQIACNIIDYGEPNHVYMTMPVGTLTDCQAPVPYAGVFDLAGNVNEWEDACETTARPELDNCRRVGGSYWTTSSACTAFGNLSRSYETDSVGFRCCSQ
jgi:formylglycine-generating enzyme required for sulfatase activity